MATAEPLTVEVRTYGHLVFWGPDGRDREVAVVIEEEPRVYRCCRCRVSSCDHATAVLHHVIERESS